MSGSDIYRCVFSISSLIKECSVFLALHTRDIDSEYSKHLQEIYTMTGYLTLALLALCLAPFCAAEVFDRVVCDTSVDGDIYGFSSKPYNASLIGGDITFDVYQGQVVLIVNVATYDALTTESYLMLNELVDLYAGQPFTVLGYPTQQFNREQPETTAEEFYNALFYVRPGGGFVPKFEIFSKTDVNGPSKEGVYGYLQSACSYTEDLFRTDLEYTSLDIYDVRHPFEKFLVGKDGKAQFRYHASLSSPEDIVGDIDALINA